MVPLLPFGLVKHPLECERGGAFQAHVLGFVERQGHKLDVAPDV